jgi:two-component sensor histidine kinase
MNWRRLSPGSAEAYALATCMVIVASLVRWGLGLLTDDVQAFTTFYPAVLFATLVGGAGVGIFTTILSGLISGWKFLSPNDAFLHVTSADEINLLTFVFASLVIVWATDHYRRLIKRLEDEEKFRKLAVEELAHRLKNKLATIQAIIGFRLREHPDVKDKIIRSLGALSATDDLIMASQGRGADLRDILSAELAPYDVSRISMEGPNCLVPPKQALMMALLVHELATNAAKYGSFSNSTGRISINWSYSEPGLTIDWRESGGPFVTLPTHRGFGSRLFLRALEQFGGKVEPNFASTGLICKLSIVLAGVICPL